MSKSLKLVIVWLKCAFSVQADEKLTGVLQKQ